MKEVYKQYENITKPTLTMEKNMVSQKVLFNFGDGKIQVKSNRGKIYNAFCSRKVENPREIKIGDYVQVEFLPNAYGRKSPYITQHIEV